MENGPVSNSEKMEKTLKELLEESKAGAINFEDLDKFSGSFGALSNEQIALGLIEGLEHNVAEFEEKCKRDDGSFDQLKLRDWLLHDVGVRTLRTGSGRNFYWLADGVFYVEKEIEGLGENSPLRKRAEDAIKKAKPIIDSFVTDPEIIRAAADGDRWGESHFIFSRRSD